MQEDIANTLGVLWLTATLLVMGYQMWRAWTAYAALEIQAKGNTMKLILNHKEACDVLVARVQDLLQCHVTHLNCSITVLPDTSYQVEYHFTYERDEPQHDNTKKPDDGFATDAAVSAAPHGSIIFHTQAYDDEHPPLVELRKNGDILVKGKCIENDHALVDAMREFLAAMQERHSA